MSSHGSDGAEADGGTVAPLGVNHVVLNVHDIEESHAFWTEIVGLRQVGTLHPDPATGRHLAMRFYSGDHGGRPSHHDLALVENRNLPPRTTGGDPLAAPNAINHVAIAMPDRDSFVRKLAELQEKGVRFHRRVNHGATHSVYIQDPNGYGVEILYELPRALWEDDIDAALNYLERLPTEGAGALQDDIESAPRFPLDGG